jgi:CCR4-NOT transcription complex subunit 1
LTCPSKTNLFRFGLQAFSRFESRLSEWQPLCHWQALLQIPHLVDDRPELVVTIQRAIASAGEAGGQTDQRSMSLLSADQGPIFTTIQPDQIEGDLEDPPEELSDRILFIVNNLAPSNFETKLTKMRGQFEDRYARWFANYLVDQRISTEPNNHHLYLCFLDALDREGLSRFVLRESLAKSANMLNLERTMQSSTECATLKMLGLGSERSHWLGTGLSNTKICRSTIYLLKGTTMAG